MVGGLLNHFLISVDVFIRIKQPWTKRPALFGEARSNRCKHALYNVIFGMTATYITPSKRDTNFVVQKLN